MAAVAVVVVVVAAAVATAAEATSLVEKQEQQKQEQYSSDAWELAVHRRNVTAELAPEKQWKRNQLTIFYPWL